jgi:hypothetical protein
MKRLSPFCLFVLAVFSCTSSGSVTDGRIEMMDSVDVTVLSFKDGLKSINHQKKIYTPTEKDRVICAVDVQISNPGNQRLGNFDSLELVTVSKSGNVDFAGNSRFIDAAEDGLEATLYFIHDKNLKAAAVMIDRNDYIILLAEKDQQYGAVAGELKKQPLVRELLGQAADEKFEVINKTRLENKIEIDAEDSLGQTLLFIGILSGNDSVVAGSIQNGAGLHKRALTANGRLIEPIHAAVMVNNKFAIQTLIAAGCDLNQEVNGYSPVFAALDAENLDAIKTLRELGVDLANARMRTPRGGISALNYAKNRRLDSIARYLQGLQ